jgi:hypothetical protein
LDKIETTIKFIGCNQVANFYDIPRGDCIGQSNAKLVDANKAGLEVALAAMNL